MVVKPQGFLKNDAAQERLAEIRANRSKADEERIKRIQDRSKAVETILREVSTWKDDLYRLVHNFAASLKRAVEKNYVQRNGIMIEFS